MTVVAAFPPESSPAALILEDHRLDPVPRMADRTPPEAAGSFVAPRKVTSKRGLAGADWPPVRLPASRRRPRPQRW